jgi:hypothetical protein
MIYVDLFASTLKTCFFEERRVGIPFTGVTSLDLCASLKSGPGFPMLYIVFFYIQRVDDER